MSPPRHTSPDPIPAEPPLSEVLRLLAQDERPTVPLQEIASALRGRVHAFALLVLALPETIPLPVPSASIVLGPPLVLIAGHMLIHGDGAALPARLRKLRVPTSAMRQIHRWVGPVIRWIEGLSAPHWSALAARQHLAGLACLYLAIVLALPIPLLNFIPAVCLAAITIGLIRHDGLYIAAGLVGTAALTIALVVLADWATNIVFAWFG